MIDGQHESIEEVGPAQNKRRRRRVRKEAPNRKLGIVYPNWQIS